MTAIRVEHKAATVCEPTSSRVVDDGRSTAGTSGSRIMIRPARVADAAAIWRTLPEIGNLERNSPYAYMLLCSHFADTSAIAQQDGNIVGLALGYRPPTQPESLFVWQVGVVPGVRGDGVAGRLLDAVLSSPTCVDVRYLCATVSPDNAPSLALFHGFARRRRVPCVETPCFPGVLFPELHADENLLRIGPFFGPIEEL
jgi:L-2,4-diaminobutyric acid acetyltransferase